LVSLQLVGTKRGIELNKISKFGLNNKSPLTGFY